MGYPLSFYEGVHRNKQTLDLNLFFFVSVLDDPYYCGLRARIPNFVKKKKKSSDSSMSSSKLSSKLTSSTTASASSLMNLGGVAGKTGQPQQVTSHPFWWHSRLYSENPGQLGPGQFSKFSFRIIIPLYQF